MLQGQWDIDTSRTSQALACSAFGDSVSKGIICPELDILTSVTDIGRSLHFRMGLPEVNKLSGRLLKFNFGKYW